MVIRMGHVLLRNSFDSVANVYDTMLWVRGSGGGGGCNVLVEGELVGFIYHGPFQMDPLSAADNVRETEFEPIHAKCASERLIATPFHLCSRKSIWVFLGKCMDIHGQHQLSSTAICQIITQVPAYSKVSDILAIGSKWNLTY